MSVSPSRKEHRICWVVVLLLGISTASVSFGKDAAHPTGREVSNLIHVPAFDLPQSSFLRAETRAALAQQVQERELLGEFCPVSSFKDAIAARACYEKYFYAPLIARQNARYRVKMQAEVIGGVPVEIVTPADGVPESNQHRVLINLHEGMFVMGAPGRAESIPISAVGKYKVVSVDYRLAPQHRFPEASEDVAAVYRELLKTYHPKNVGIYGCSAGGLLTAQAVVWFQKQGLPSPGAIGMFCTGATYWGEGDSGFYAAARLGLAVNVVTVSQENPYLKDADANDPLVFPARSPQVLAKFPPSLLITSTRDAALSSVVNTHARLVAQGVDAQLHIWEGLDHAFILNPELPESREAYDVIAQFFERHLARH